MDIRDKLVASPVNIKFQAPFPHNQKRRMNILNLSNTKLQYRVEVEDEELFQAVPANGKIAAYNTDELTVFMKPSTGVLKTCAIKVVYKAAPEEPDASDQSDQSERTVDNPQEESPKDWETACCTQVPILVENCVESDAELSRMFALDPSSKNLSSIAEQQYKPICTNCCLKRTDPKVLANKSSWKRWLFWPAGIATLAVTVYFGCQLLGLNLFNLKTEKIF